MGTRTAKRLEMAEFLNETCKVGGRVGTLEMWNAWEAWAVGRGIDTRGRAWFGRDLAEAVPAMEKRLGARDAAGRRACEYRGLSLGAPEGPWVTVAEGKGTNIERLERAVDRLEKALLRLESVSRD